MIYAPDGFSVESYIQGLELVKRGRGERKKKGEREILNAVTAFDIECSTIRIPTTERVADQHSFMYVWQWALDTDTVIVGRTWDEFLRFERRIAEACREYGEKAHLPEPPLMVSYVHNLAYEWQFLAGIYTFQQQDTFFAKARKPIYCRMCDALEFRCSYKLANMSLDKFAENMCTTVRKKSGQKFDYSKIRYPWTPLTEFELDYITSDVVALVEALTIQLSRDGDTLRTVPLTSTGYVRRDCKKALSDIRNYVIKPMLPTVEQYRLLRKAFRGGNTHANPAYVGRVLDNVESVDMASCYPAQQLTKLFPMQPFRMLKGHDVQRVLKFISLGYAVVCEWSFEGLRVKNPAEPCPYLSLAKTKSRTFTVDNGRILTAAVCHTTLTEVDLRIVLQQYTFDKIECGAAMVAKKAPLPAAYRDVIMDYYRYKTGMKAAAKEDAEIEYRYMKSKNKLNSVYGMSAQDPIHQRITFDGVGFVTSDYDDAEAVEDLGRAPFPYQWGVYTTAYAREALQEGIDLAGERLVYCDTDSVKTYGHVDFSALNVSRETIARKNGAVALDEKKKPHAVGVFEVDGKYDQFITQGAKRYAYIDQKGMHVTVSGVTHKVNEETGIQFCVEELQTLERFAPGMRWVKAGGTTAVYNDDDNFIYHTPDGDVLITRNVSIVETTYEMTHTEDYIELLKKATLYGKWVHEHE